MNSHLILIVEEHEATRAFLADQLTCDGYEILLANSRRHALHLLSSHHPQLVLADINGETLGLLDAVRGGEGLAGEIDPNTPLIVLTARTDELARVRVFDRGGDDVVAKPFSYPELRGRIRALLRRAYDARTRARHPDRGAEHRPPRARSGRGRAAGQARREGVRAAPLPRLRADPRVHQAGAVARRVALRVRLAFAHRRLACGKAQAEARRGRGRAAARDQRLVDRLPAGRWRPGRRGAPVSAERIGDLYRELALHRVGEAIEALGASPTDRLAAQSADALEEAAAALACMTALYTSPGGRLDRRWQAQIEQLIGAAASLEQLADFDRQHHPGPPPRRGE